MRPARATPGLAAGVLLAVFSSLALGAASQAQDLPQFEITNWDGRVVDRESLKGATTIVAFTYAKCTFACPMLTFLLHDLDEELGRPPGLRYLHISVNPTADNAEEILLHFEKHGIDPVADPRWLFANGPEIDIARLLEQTGIEVRRTRVPEGVLIDHTIQVLVVGPEGNTLESFDTYHWDKEDMRHALRFAVRPS